MLHQDRDQEGCGPFEDTFLMALRNPGFEAIFRT
jgi:hypothetical protein